MKKGLSYYIQLILLSPLWYFHADKSKRKPWAEFKSGLIKHKCDFEGGEVEIKEYGGSLYSFRKCKHFGCNMMEPID